MSVPNPPPIPWEACHPDFSDELKLSFSHHPGCICKVPVNLRKQNGTPGLSAQTWNFPLVAGVGGSLRPLAAFRQFEEHLPHLIMLFWFRLSTTPGQPTISEKIWNVWLSFFPSHDHLSRERLGQTWGSLPAPIYYAPSPRTTWIYLREISLSVLLPLHKQWPVCHGNPAGLAPHPQGWELP